MTAMRRWLRQKGKGMFGRFFVSYFIILLIPLLIGMHAYQETVKVVREDAASFSQAVLEQSEESVSKLLLEIRDIVSLISLDQDLIALMLNAGPDWTPSDIYQFSLQRNELSKLSTNQYFSNLYVYLKQSGTIISTDHIERLQTHPMRIGGVSFGQWLEQVTAREQVNAYHRLEQVSHGNTTGNYLAYVSPLPEGYSSHVEGAVVIMIKEQTIVRLFQRLLGAEGSFASIVDEQGQLLVAASSGQAPQLSVPTTGEASGYRQLTLEGERMLVSYKRSPSSGWTYVAGQPADEVFSKADYIKRINLFIMLAAGAVGLLAALLLAYRNSKPLSELAESVGEFVTGSERGGRVTDMYSLKRTVGEIISHTRSLHTVVQEQLPLLRSNVLERLCKGGFAHASELDAHLEQARLELHATQLAAVVKLCATESGSAASLPPGWQPSAPLGWGGQLHAHALKPDRVAILFTFSGYEPEPELELAERQLLLVQTELLRQYNLPCLIGIGRPVSSGLELWRSCQEATQALERQPDGSGTIVRYDSFLYHPHDYYYPLELEQKLINTVRTGYTQGLQQLLDHLEEQNFRRRQLSLRHTRLLLYALHGTLLRLTDLSAAAASEPLPEPGESSENEGAQSAFARYAALLLERAEQARQQQDTGAQERLESMKRLIADRYSDPSFSLAVLADALHVTESMASGFFKEQLGVTFSDYVERIRLEQACVLLKQSDQPIQVIALAVGYNSDKSFRRAFKRALGIQPTTYRKVPDALA